MNDYLSTVVLPKYGEEYNIQKMNSLMILYHPALKDECRDNRELREECFNDVNGIGSIVDLFKKK